MSFDFGEVNKGCVHDLLFWEDLVAIKMARFVVAVGSQEHFLTSESVQSTSLSLEGIDDIHGGDGLPLGVLGVGDGIPDDILKENLQDSSGLFIDESRNTLDSTSAGKTTDGWLGDTLDVITKYLPVTLGASLSESLSSFTTS